MFSGLYPKTKGAEQVKEELWNNYSSETIKEKLYHLESICNAIENAGLPNAECMDLDDVWRIVRDEDLSVNDLINNFVEVSNILLNIREQVEQIRELESDEDGE